MRADPTLYSHCKMSDRCGGLEASKYDKPCIYRCHAGLTDFSIPLVIAGHLMGFILCGQVRIKNDVSLDNVHKGDQSWKANHELVAEHEKIPLVDYSKIISAANLLKIIVDTYIKINLNLIVVYDAVTPRLVREKSETIYDAKIKKALRYIDSHFSDELRLEEVSSHVYLSPYYFSKLFKNQLGIGFNTYVTQQKMNNAKQILQCSDWSIADIAKKTWVLSSKLFLQGFPPVIPDHTSRVSKDIAGQ